MTAGRTGGIPQQAQPVLSTPPTLGPIPLGDNGHRGDYGEQFVQALAIAANLDVSRSAFRDRMGVDWQLNYPGRAGTIRFPAIEVQVKCWSSPTGDDHVWRYPLKVHNFNMLAGCDWQVPRFLFLVVVPSDVGSWVDVSSDCFLMRNAAYWACFQEAEPLEDRPKDSTCTVSVARENLLTVPVLHSLFGPEFRERLVTS